MYTCIYPWVYMNSFMEYKCTYVCINVIVFPTWT